MEEQKISNMLEIESYFHCALCLQEWKAEHSHTMSPKDYQRIQVGFTRRGMQVWCVRHDINIIHIDFQGMTHPANLTRRKQKED